MPGGGPAGSFLYGFAGFAWFRSRGLHTCEIAPGHGVRAGKRGAKPGGRGVACGRGIVECVAGRRVAWPGTSFTRGVWRAALERVC